MTNNSQKEYKIKGNSVGASIVQSFLGGTMTKQQIIYSACIAGIISGTMLFLWYAARTLYRNRQIIITTDQQLTPAVTSAVHEIVQRCINQDQVTCAQPLFDQLKKTVPELARVSMNYYIVDKIKVSIVCDAPFLIIKQEGQTPLVMARSGLLTAYNHYRPEMLNNVPIVSVTAPVVAGYERFTEQARELFHWAEQLPDYFFTRYAVQWKKPTEIILRDSNGGESFSYSVTCTTKITPQMEQQWAQARQKILDNPKKKKYKAWNIDRRFKDQLVIRGGA